MRCAAVCLLLALIVPYAAAAAEPESKGRAELHSKIDQLLQWQDAAAAGSLAAVSQQKKLLVAISPLLASVAESDLPKLAGQAVAYVLSGGNPSSIDRFASLEAVMPRDRKLLEAAALFMRGDRQGASKAFAQIDALRLPSRIAGRVALAKSLLVDGQARQMRLAEALGAMPGTLIEESSLRRSALAYAAAHDERNFWRRAERFARRFPASIYAERFWRDVMGSIVAWYAKGAPPSLARLDATLASLPRDQRRRLYLDLAHKAAIAGLSKLTEDAGRRVTRLAVEDSEEERLGQFYSSLFLIVSPEGDEALLRLKSIDRRLLQPDEVALLEAAVSLGSQIDDPPNAEPSPADEGTPESTVQQSRGAELLANSDKLLVTVQ